MVIDSGIGIDEQILERAAEPFITIKGVGKGIGLGLSMILATGYGKILQRCAAVMIKLGKPFDHDLLSDAIAISSRPLCPHPHA